MTTLSTASTQISSIPIAVDYTSRDYYSIRQDLINLIQTRIPTWTATDSSDFGVALVEAFAYVGDLISYYIDRSANEYSIGTATQRSSILNIAQTFGYIPAGTRASYTTINFFNSTSSITASLTAASGDGTTLTFTGENTFVPNGTVTVTGFSTSGFNVTSAYILTASPTQFTVANATTGSETADASATEVPPSITIPEGTVVSGQISSGDTVVTTYFTTLADTIVPSNSSNSVTATAGQLVSLVSPNAIPVYGELIGTSDGTPSQQMVLLQTPVVDDGSLEIYVQTGDTYALWSSVQNITDAVSTDTVYVQTLDENGNVFITFGDGVSGAIPTIFSEVRAMYSVGGGAVSNIATNTIDTISYVPGLSDSQVTALQSIITVTNSTVAVGGDDPETNDSIRIAAPQSLRAINRAVTVEDYASLALSVAGVGKANSSAGTWTSVNVYIAPVRLQGTANTDLQPGLDENGNPTTEYENLEDSVQTFLSSRSLIGSTTSVQPPQYVDLSLTIEYNLQPYGVQATAESNILANTLTAYSYSGMNFADTIYPQDIESILQNTVGDIRRAVVTKLFRTGVSVTGVTGTGTVVTYTTNVPHGFIVGSSVTITGFSVAGYNVTNAVVATVPSLTTFTISNTTTGSATGTGVLTGLSDQLGQPYEIFRVQQSNITLSSV